MRIAKIPCAARDASCGQPALIAATACAGLALVLLTALTATAIVRIVTGAYGATGDFISFWSAGYIVRTGDGARLYDPAVQEAVQRAHYAGGFRSADGYIMPVFVAWLFAPAHGVLSSRAVRASGALLLTPPEAEAEVILASPEIREPHAS